MEQSRIGLSDDKYVPAVTEEKPQYEVVDRTGLTFAVWEAIYKDTVVITFDTVRWGAEKFHLYRRGECIATISKTELSTNAIYKLNTIIRRSDEAKAVHRRVR